MIAVEVPVLIRVDQIEEMHRAFTERQRVLLLSFRKMLNRVFYSRDARVHYRAGTRRYGWDNPEFLGVWGSEARLENRRNYHRIEMDEEIFLLSESNTRRKNLVFFQSASEVPCEVKYVGSVIAVLTTSQAALPPLQHIPAREKGRRFFAGMKGDRQGWRECGAISLFELGVVV